MDSPRAWLVIANEKGGLVSAAAHFRELFEMDMAIDVDVHWEIHARMPGIEECFLGQFSDLGLDKSKPRRQDGMQLVQWYLRVNLDCLRSTNQLFNIVQLRGLEFKLLSLRSIGMAFPFEFLISYGNVYQPFRSFTYFHNFANFRSRHLLSPFGRWISSRASHANK
jgi:hypothetical protein